MDGSPLEEKSFFKMLGLTFSSKLEWGFYIISFAKTASKKIGALKPRKIDYLFCVKLEKSRQASLFI